MTDETDLPLHPDGVALLSSAFNTVTQGIAIYNRELQLEVWSPYYAQMGISQKTALYRGAELYSLYLEFAKAGVFGLGDQQQLARQQVESVRRGDPSLDRPDECAFNRAHGTYQTLFIT